MQVEISQVASGNSFQKDGKSCRVAAGDFSLGSDSGTVGGRLSVSLLSASTRVNLQV
jgi:hypothetical protein